MLLSMKALIITMFISFVFTSGRLYLALFLTWNELDALFVIVFNCRQFIVIFGRRVLFPTEPMYT